MNAILFLIASCVYTSTPAPLCAREAVVDRGNVFAGAILTQSFSLQNHGSTSLRVTDIRVGCGCLHPKIASRVLQPGQTTEVVVEVNTLSQPAGANSWKVTIRSIDETDQQAVPAELELVLKAKLIREVRVEPVALHLSIDRETTHSITITDRRDKPLTATEVRCSAKHVKTQLTTVGVNAQGERIQQVRLTVLEDCPPGESAEIVQIITDDLTHREFRVPLRITRKVPGLVTAVPEQLTLNLAKGQTIASGLVRLRDPDDKPVVVERIETDHPAVRTKWAPGPGATATLRLGIELTTNSTSGLAIVKVHLKEPKVQTIVIPINWQLP